MKARTKYRSIITDYNNSHWIGMLRMCVSMSVTHSLSPTAVTKTGVSDLDLRWVRLVQNGTNSELKVRFQSEFNDFKKSQIFPFCANLTHFGPKIWPISGPKSDILQTLSDPYFYVSAHNVMFIYLVNVLTVTVAVVSSTQGWHILAYNYNGTNFRTNQLLKDQFGERNVHLVPIGPTTDLPFIPIFSVFTDFSDLLFSKNTEIPTSYLKIPNF